MTNYISTFGSVEAPFNGSLDGNGYTIEDLTIYSLDALDRSFRCDWLRWYC